ncbi:MAG TPA: lipocalin-like domain-containing protein [Gemmatimonadales bacterium]|nr:lipocalin-like domain-containing protein [Gemmatimonadales bacterium]
MTLRRLLTFSVVCAATTATTGAAQQRSIVGTWLLQSIVDTLPDHSVYYWLGRHPTGIIIYDSSGHVAVQLVRDPPPHFSGDASTAASAVLQDAYEGYYAYFGHYRLNARGDTVTHIIEFSQRPDESGRVYRRGVHVVGDLLVLIGPMEAHGVPYRRVITWKRAR